MYGYNAGQPMAIPVLPYCVIIEELYILFKLPVLMDINLCFITVFCFVFPL